MRAIDRASSQCPIDLTARTDQVDVHIGVLVIDEVDDAPAPDAERAPSGRISERLRAAHERVLAEYPVRIRHPLLGFAIHPPKVVRGAPGEAEVESHKPSSCSNSLPSTASPRSYSA